MAGVDLVMKMVHSRIDVGCKLFGEILGLRRGSGVQSLGKAVDFAQELQRAPVHLRDIDQVLFLWFPTSQERSFRGALAEAKLG